MPEVVPALVSVSLDEPPGPDVVWAPVDVVAWRPSVVSSAHASSGSRTTSRWGRGETMQKGGMGKARYGSHTSAWPPEDARWIGLTPTTTAVFMSGLAVERNEVGNHREAEVAEGALGLLRRGRVVVSRRRGEGASRRRGADVRGQRATELGGDLLRGGDGRSDAHGPGTAGTDGDVDARDASEDRHPEEAMACGGGQLRLEQGGDGPRGHRSTERCGQPVVEPGRRVERGRCPGSSGSRWPHSGWAS